MGFGASAVHGAVRDAVDRGQQRSPPQTVLRGEPAQRGHGRRRFGPVVSMMRSGQQTQFELLEPAAGKVNARADVVEAVNKAGFGGGALRGVN